MKCTDNHLKKFPWEHIHRTFLIMSLLWPLTLWPETPRFRAPSLLPAHLPAVPQSIHWNHVLSSWVHTDNLWGHREGRSEVTVGPSLLQDQADSGQWELEIKKTHDYCGAQPSVGCSHLFYMENTPFLIPSVVKHPPQVTLPPLDPML